MKNGEKCMENWDLLNLNTHTTIIRHYPLVFGVFFNDFRLYITKPIMSFRCGEHIHEVTKQYSEGSGPCYHTLMQLRSALCNTGNMDPFPLTMLFHLYH